MSADDGYIVSELYGLRGESRVGVFYYLGTYPEAQDRTERNARLVSSSPIRAILMAHKENHFTGSEHGVSIDRGALDRAIGEYAIVTDEVR